MIAAPPAEDLAAILKARGNPMAACRAPWLRQFREVPADAAPPLAMSGRHKRAVGSYGADCIAWAERELGITMRWWQALAITRQLEHDKDGLLVWREINETGPRRIGKSTRLRAVALWRTAHAHLIGETQLSMLVSKDLAIGKEIHRGSWRWAERKGWKVTRLNGGQEVEAADESRWLLRADTAVYGYDVGYGQVDESWSADPMAITEGLEPALLERLWPQLHLTSTAHVKASSLMRRRLTAALKDADPDVLLLFWGAPPGADLSDPKVWKAASPHWSEARRELVERKYLAALAGQDEPEFDDPDPMRGWAAQYLNVWPLLLGSGADALVMPHWDQCAASPVGPMQVAALGVAVDPDRVWVSVGCRSADTVPHLAPVTVLHDDEPMVLRRRLDLDRELVMQEVKRIQGETGCQVVIDKKGPAASVGEDLEAIGVIITWVGLDDVVNACAWLFDAVAAKEITQADDPELNDAVRAATKRKVGDRWAWARWSGDISMLEAVTLAYGGSQIYDVAQSAW